jgi:hypothetical protein
MWWRVVLTVLVVGCASERPAPAPIKIVKKQCTTTVKPDEAFCSTRKNCPQIETCGEAYYRYTTCRHLWLDGGVAPREGKEPDGIPCEVRCSGNALEMAKAIRDKPFSPPTTASTVCNPA